MIIYPPTLLAEDDDNDVFFMQVAWRKAGIPNPLIVVRNGQEVIEHLKRARLSSDPANHPCPSLLLLDISMPVLNGFDVLAWLKHQSFGWDLVVVVLTSSANPGDIEKAKALGAADYLVKPCNAGELVRMARELQVRWLTSRVECSEHATSSNRDI